MVISKVFGQETLSFSKPSEIPIQSKGMYEGNPTFRAVFVDDGPKVDGDLTDKAWNRAMPAGYLLQTFPEDNTS